jgi:hypothetical protein
MTKTKIALAAALLAAAASASGTLAQAAQARTQKHGNAHLQSAAVLQQRNVSLPAEGRFATGPIWYNGSGPTTGGM